MVRDCGVCSRRKVEWVGHVEVDLESVRVAMLACVSSNRCGNHRLGACEPEAGQGEGRMGRVEGHGCGTGVQAQEEGRWESLRL